MIWRTELDTYYHQMGFFQTCHTLFAEDLGFDYVSLWQSSEFSKPHDRDVRKNIRCEGRGFKCNLMSEDADSLQTAKVLEEPLEFHWWCREWKDEKRWATLICGHRRGFNCGATARAGAGFICAEKNTVIMFMACSAMDGDGLATVCGVGPEHPRDLDMDSPASLTPWKSGMLAGWYLVVSPVAYKHDM